MARAHFEIYHNPRCSKSRQALERLSAAGIEPVVIEYLVHPPTKARLRELVALLGMAHPRALMRTNESAYAAMGLADVTDPDELLDTMVAHPILIERPIVVRDGTRAVLGRPPELVDRLL